MHTGGIETLILRFSDWLIKNGYSVDVLLIKQEGELLGKLNNDINIFQLGYYYEFNFLTKYICNKLPIDVDVIFSFSPITTWMALLMRQVSKKETVVFNGIYHLFDYQIFASKFQRRVFNSHLPDQFKLFMTISVKEEHERIIKRDISGSYIFPLPIDITKFKNLKRVPLKSKIVSMGRLTDFKTYNILLLGVIKNLIEKGFDVNYHIYGDGTEKELIKSEIMRLNLINYVFLHGTIDYDRIIEIFSDAYLFVGMGTSAIEAGVSGIPTIVAIAYEKETVTHGLIHELPNFNSGELITDYPKIQLFDVIKNILSLSEFEYKLLCKQSSSILSSQYDIDVLMLDFLNYVNKLNNSVIVFPKLRIPIFFILQQTLWHFWNKSKSEIKKLIK